MQRKSPAVRQRAGPDHRLVLRRVASIVLALIAGAAPVCAQAIRGTVVLADSVTPARGVIVLATGEAGATVGRTLTNSRGDFSITLPAATRVGVTILRIGYRPTVLSSSAVGDAGSGLRIVLSSEPIPLGAIRVRAQDECRINPDSGLLVARVWEEARKAMLTSQLATAGEPLVAEWVVYDRALDAGARIVQEQRIHSARNATTHAFRSMPAEFLASSGYVVEDSAATAYYAPDADVLMSSSFARLHCFRLVAPLRDEPELIGVGFQPTHEKSGIRDIEGTFWVDRRTAEGWIVTRTSGASSGIRTCPMPLLPQGRVGSSSSCGLLTATGWSIDGRCACQGSARAAEQVRAVSAG